MSAGDVANKVLFQISGTPITPVTLVMVAAVAVVSALAGPVIRAALNRALLSGKAEDETSATGGRFGTFGGVFAPSILTILGVVMYLSVGSVVGNVGLGGMLIVVVISHLITGATGLSVSSIATNRTIGAGGAYFIISRSLGAPVGAASGIPLFFGQALSVTFYVVGFTQTLQPFFPNVPPQLMSSGVLLIVALVALKSADLALKVQYLVMAAIGLSLLSFFSGWKQPSFEAATANIDWWVTDQDSFAKVFAVFFPAVTGIMAGVGMSGDLKDPRESLPKGTMWAILVGFIVYMAFPIWLSLNATSNELLTDPKVVWKVSRFPALIYLGVWGATLSSAVGSILTAPRTLQALANDGLAPRILGRGSGPNNEPRVGVLVTFGIAQVGILFGGLDAIAPVLTMFFLATYGLVNLACGLEKWAASPSFRPAFAVPAFVSLAGGASCIYVMSIINMGAMIAALMFCGLIYVVAQRRALNTTYGDARHGIWAAIVRSALHRLKRVDFHPLNWRPNLIILGGDQEKRPWLLELGSSIVQERGLVTYVQMVSGDVEEMAPTCGDATRGLNERIEEVHPNVFGRVEIVDDKYKAAVTIVQAYGVGSLRANTVMLGWPNSADHRPEYVQMLRNLDALDHSLLIVKHNDRRKFGRRRQIHIWWGGMQGNGGMMLLAAYLLTAHDRWRNADISIHVIVTSEAQENAAEAGILDVCARARVQATPVVIQRDGRKITDVMHEVSGSADLAIAGLRLPRRNQNSDQFFERMDALLEGMPTTILVHTAQSFEGEPLLFDEKGPEVPKPEPPKPEPSQPQAPAAPEAQASPQEPGNTATEPSDNTTP